MNMKQANRMHVSDLRPPDSRPCTAAVMPELRRVVTQESLLNTRASLAGLSHMRGSDPAPRCVFVGVGMSSASELSRALPLDVLSMLFASERVRVAIEAREIKLLLADAHALENGHHAALVSQCCASYEGTLRHVLARLGWSHVQLLRASDVHAQDTYARLHEKIRRIAPSREHSYVTRELADIEYFYRECGGIVKVGWALTNRAPGLRDEPLFDDRFRRWVGSRVGFVYCKADRTLDDRRMKTAPYVVSDTSRRVCLSRGELVQDKLQRCAASISRSTLRAVRSHLRAITRSYKQLVGPISGPVEEQAQRLIWELLGSEVSA
jgi:hypothetical protein